jgi:hypothetical protein
MLNTLHTHLIPPFAMKERGMMSRQPRLIQLSLGGTILLCLLISVYLVACRWFSRPDPAGTVVKHPVDTKPDDVLEYWTPDKMRNAKPADLPNVTALERGKRHRQRPPHTSGPERS